MVRLGKHPKKSRSSWVPAGEYTGGTPSRVSPDTVVGRVTPDLIDSVWTSLILDDLAEPMLERYADDLLLYQEQLAAYDEEHQQQQEEEVVVGEDGSTTTTSPSSHTGGRPVPPDRPLFHSQAAVDDFAETLAETSEHFFAAKKPGWKIHANAARFERMLDEKYGVFRPFVTEHPRLERAVRSVQRKYAMGHFSPLRPGGPPIPRSTSVVILFLMKRGGVQWQVMTLAVLFFLVGLQPWALVAVVAVMQTLVVRRQSKPIGTMKSRIAAVEPYYCSATENSNDHDEDEASIRRRKQKLLLTKVGKPFGPNESIDDTSAYDTIVLGYGHAALYPAALLSRAGRKVLVLSSRSDASGCLTLEQCAGNKNKAAVAEQFRDVPFDAEASNVPKITGQQKIMAPALCTTTDCQGGVRFAKVGTDADGHAFEILSIPGPDGGGAAAKDGTGFLFVLKGDDTARAIVGDAAAELGDGWPDADGGIGSSGTGAFLAACESINATASLFYLTKLLPDSVNKLRKDPAYGEAAIRYASSFLSKCFPTNNRTRSLMAAIGMRGENIRPGAISMAAHVTNICGVSSGEGMHYPIGGPRALSKAFANVVERSGGRIVTDVDVRDLLFDEEAEEGETASGAGATAGNTNDTNTITDASAADSKPNDDDGPPPPRCVGVKLSDGREIRFAKERYGRNLPDEPAVVSFQGFIDTFVRLLPEDVRTKYKVPRGLPALSERRPVFKVLFALRGSAEELSITGADYYRLPNASIAQDAMDPTTGVITHGEIGSGRRDYENKEVVGADGDETKDIIEDTNKDPSESETKRRSKRASHKTKFNTGVSWIQIAFPSAKDPSFESRHGKVTTCVVTIEADDDFVTGYDTKPKLFVVNKETAGTAGDLQRLLERVTKDLLDVYPQVEGRIEHSEVRGPYQRGLSHNPERYAAKGVRADDTPYPRLFVGGPDLTVGESFSGATFGGWLTANAVMGYKVVDLLFLRKNITSDLEQFLEQPPRLPVSDDEEDLAVPFVVAAAAPPTATNDAEEEEQ